MAEASAIDRLAFALRLLMNRTAHVPFREKPGSRPLRSRAVYSLQSGFFRKNREKRAYSAYFTRMGGDISLDLRLIGGESGIRTHVTLSSKHAFQACAFSHSAISPAETWEGNDSFPGGYRVAPRRCELAPAWPQFILWTGTRERKSAKQRDATGGTEADWN
jgi:hypothetical protein